VVNLNFEDADRARALQLLAARQTPGLARLLQKSLDENVLRSVAIRGLANYDDPATSKLLLERYSEFTAEQKSDAVQTLASRANYAKALLNAVSEKTIPKADITAFTARQIASIKDDAVAKQLAEVWGDVKVSSSQRKEKIANTKASLSAEVLSKADPSLGRQLFMKNCATCHKLYHEGQSVGPELTGSQRSNLDYLLENIIDPSAAVAKEYKMVQFYMADGRVVSGIIKTETAETVTVRTVNEEVVLSKTDIDERKATELSVMPEGLLDTLSAQDVQALIRYLQSKEQAPLPR
jgi:putative heme-binding domain-containing protein